MVSGSIHIVANGIISFFLWLSTVLFCVCVCVCVCVLVSHIFVHSAVSRHVGCFRVWAIVNGTAMNVVKVTQSCPTLCDPMGCNLPGSSVHGPLQAGTLEWVASFLPLLQGISPSQGPNPDLLHCRQTLHHLNCQGSPWTRGACVFLNYTFALIYARSGISGSHGNSIFSFLRHHHAFLHSGCTNVRSHQQCKKVLFFRHLL